MNNEAEFGLGYNYDYNYNYGIELTSGLIARFLEEVVNRLHRLGYEVISLDTQLLLKLLRITGTEISELINQAI